MRKSGLKREVAAIEPIEKGIVLNVGSGATDIILNRSKQGLIDNTRVNNLLCPKKSEGFSIDGIREYLNV